MMMELAAVVFGISGIFVTFNLATIGEVHDAGHQLEERALVLTEAEASEIFAAVRRGEAAERELFRIQTELSAVKREAAQALEDRALCETRPPPVCDCSEWSFGLAGAAVGAAACGGIWAGWSL